MTTYRAPKFGSYAEDIDAALEKVRGLISAAAKKDLGLATGPSSENLSSVQRKIDRGIRAMDEYADDCESRIREVARAGIKSIRK